jgi:hypothetical protein
MHGPYFSVAPEEGEPLDRPSVAGPLDKVSAKAAHSAPARPPNSLPGHSGEGLIGAGYPPIPGASYPGTQQASCYPHVPGYPGTQQASCYPHVPGYPHIPGTAPSAPSAPPVATPGLPPLPAGETPPAAPPGPTPAAAPVAALPRSGGARIHPPPGCRPPSDAPAGTIERPQPAPAADPEAVIVAKLAKLRSRNGAGAEDLLDLPFEPPRFSSYLLELLMGTGMTIQCAFQWCWQSAAWLGSCGGGGAGGEGRRSRAQWRPGRGAGPLTPPATLAAADVLTMLLAIMVAQGELSKYQVGCCWCRCAAAACPARAVQVRPLPHSKTPSPTSRPKEQRRLPGMIGNVPQWGQPSLPLCVCRTPPLACPS